MHTYGGMDIQIGYCNGQNIQLNGLEYHKGNEVLIAMTDLILLVGKVQDIRNNKYNSKNIIGILVPKGMGIELYSTTLHFALCKIHEEGFKSVIILPKGTNCIIQEGAQTIKNDEDELLFRKNK